MKYVVLVIIVYLLLPLGCVDPMQLKLSEADKLADAGKYEDAISIYKGIYDTKPSTEIKSKLANMYVKSAIEYIKLSNYTHAVADYNEAIIYDSSMDLKTQLSEAYYKRGSASFKKEQQTPVLMLIPDRANKASSTLRDSIPMAISDFSSAIDLNPVYKDALNDRGYAYVVITEYDKALPDLNKVIEMDPVNKVAYYGRSIAWAGKGNYDVALQDVSKAIELDKEYAKAYFWRAGVYEKYLQQYYAAVEDYSKGIELLSEKDPYYTTAINNRAVLYIDKLDQSAKAAEDFSTIIGLQPNNALAYYNRGWCYHNIRRYQESLADFQKYLVIDVNDIYHLRLYASGCIDGINRILSGAVKQ
jgi:tetratricopeptide (TPR) repeat protein